MYGKMDVAGRLLTKLKCLDKGAQIISVGVFRPGDNPNLASQYRQQTALAKSNG
jgi:hypothetical protein